MTLVIRGVSKVYPDGTHALDGVSLDVRPGEFVSLIGPSGCGKTTLLRAVAGLEDYGGGEIRFAGEVVRGRADWRRGVIYQDVRLFPWWTLRQNVEFALRCRGLGPSEAAAGAAEWIGRLGLEAHADRLPREVPAGVAQAAGVCRVLAQNPPLILCDEPFSSLDWTYREFLQELLLRHWAEHGPAVVFVTHDVEEAAWLSQRVIVMTARPGRIKAELPVPLPRERWRVPRDHTTVLAVAARVANLIREEAA